LPGFVPHDHIVKPPLNFPLAPFPLLWGKYGRMITDGDGFPLKWDDCFLGTVFNLCCLHIKTSISDSFIIVFPLSVGKRQRPAPRKVLAFNLAPTSGQNVPKCRGCSIGAFAIMLVGFVKRNIDAGTGQIPK